MGADGKGAREHIQHDVGGGGGGDIVVLRLAVEEEIANAAAGKVGIMAVGPQSTDDLDCGFELR